MSNKKIKYFYLTHGKLGLECLKGLIKKKYPPEFVVIHKSYETEKLLNDFFQPIERICSVNDIKLYKTDRVSELKNNFREHDIGICVGFMEIMGKEILYIPELGILNLHCGRLPYYRGRAPISRTIIDGKKVLTITIHKMDEGVDSGDILYEKKIQIKEDDDVNTLYEKCCKRSSEAIIKGIKKICSENNPEIAYKKQDLSLKQRPNKKISDDERRIEWNESIESIHNKIRALTIPYPCAYGNYTNKKYYFIKSEELHRKIDKTKKPGEIMLVDENYILINCNDGLLKITDIQNDKGIKIDFKEVFKKGGKFK